MVKSVKMVDAVKGYMLSRRSKKLSDSTLRWYRQKLAHFTAFLDEEHEVTLLKQVDINLLREYVEDLRESKAYEGHPSKRGPWIMISWLITRLRVMFRSLKVFLIGVFRKSCLLKIPLYVLIIPLVGIRH